jgi:hypothetical protein
VWHECELEQMRNGANVRHVPGTRIGANVRHECELEQMRNDANVRHVASLWKDMRRRTNACLGGKICDSVRMCGMENATAQMCDM